MTKIVSITALKGGTGKTIVTFNIATMLAKLHNKKVLVVDIDPQHNMTNFLKLVKWDKFICICTLSQHLNIFPSYH